MPLSFLTKFLIPWNGSLNTTWPAPHHSHFRQFLYSRENEICLPRELYYPFFMTLRVPTVASKTLGPLLVLEFMGVVLHSNCMEAQLPEDKLARIRPLLDSFTDCSSARLLDLQSLIGTLQFTCRVVVLGKTFLQHIINLTRGVKIAFIISD